MRRALKAVQTFLTRRRARRLATARAWGPLLFPWFLIGVGVALAAVSFAASVQLVDSFEASGTVPAGTIASVAINSTGSAYSEVFLRGAPPCDLALYVLDLQEAATFQNMQALPSDYLGCQQNHAVYEDPIALLVLENLSGSAVPYDVRVEFVGLTQPYGLWILPASALLAVGGMIEIRRALQGGLTRLVDELAARDAVRPPIDRDRPRR